MQSIPDLIERLRAAGGKVTPQRLFLFRVLESATSHPTAEELYETLRHELPTLSLGTVYKILNELVDLGELATVDSGDGLTRYDPNTVPHAHLRCIQCGAFQDCSLELLGVKIPENINGFVVTSQRIVLEGYCATCAQANPTGLTNSQRARERHTHHGRC
jgi:Fur family peroxide stress response transcriptional regulator